MNSNFYETLTSINTNWLRHLYQDWSYDIEMFALPSHLGQKIRGLDEGLEELQEIIKANQLNNPEVLKSYCLAALDQINTEYKRLRKQFQENKDEPDFVKYRYWLNAIIFKAFKAQQLIIECLGIYSPEVFTGSKLDLLSEFLPDSNPIRKQIVENLKNINQQPKEAKQESGTTTTNRNKDGILRYVKSENYPARVFALADYLLKVVNSPKADPFIDTSSRKILNNYGLTRFGVNDFYNAYYNFIPHKFNQFKNKKEHWSELAKLQKEEKAKRPEFHKELQAAILDITNNDTDISDWFMGVNRL